MARIKVRVQPGAKSDAILGWIADPQGGEVLRLRLRAAAVDGKANTALIEFLAESFGLRPRQVVLERGAKLREKVISLEGLTLDEIKRRMP
jgi:hypothetical protein